MSDPATLIDCRYCDGTYWPYDDHCSFCGKPTGERDIFYCKICKQEIFGTLADHNAHVQQHREGEQY